MNNIFSNVINRANNTFRQSRDRPHTHQMQDASISVTNQSLMQNFPQIPINQAIYGFYELNGQFCYANSSDFDKGLINVKKNVN